MLQAILFLMLMTPQADKAQQVLSQARAAMGGETRLAAVKSLSVSGKYRRSTGSMQMGGELELDFLLPDKFLRSDTVQGPGGATSTLLDALNGDQAWRDTRNGPSMGGGMMMIRRDGANDPAALAAQTRQLRQDAARYLVALLLTAPGNMPLQFKYAGEAEAEDGRADALDITGPDNFQMRLFIDTKTHLPLMISYQGPAPMLRMQTATAQRPPSREDLERMAQRAHDEAPPRPPQVEVQLRFSDYGSENGIQFPHHIGRTMGTDVSEEWDVTTFKVNPPLKADHFVKK